MPAAARAQSPPQPPVPLPSPFTPIVDYAHVIDADTRSKLEAIFLNLRERAQIEYSVLTVDTTNGQDIFDFAQAVARGWGIEPKGGEKTSFFLVVAIQDRKYITLVSDHLEGDLPDGLVGQIQRERLVPAFKQKNYSKGIYDTIQKELRSQYLLAYQSSQEGGTDKFRAIEVKIGKPGMEAKTVRGYYP